MSNIYKNYNYIFFINVEIITFGCLNNDLIASTMETPIFEYLNGSHTYKSLIYNFLIVVFNKYSIPPTHILHKVRLINQLSIPLWSC